MKTYQPSLKLVDNKKPLQNIEQLRRFFRGEKTEGQHWTDELSNVELAKELRLIGQINRFCAQWKADPEFRQQILTEPEQAVICYNLDVDPEEIRILWDEELGSQEDESVQIPYNLKNYRRFIQDQQNWGYELKRIADSSWNPRFKAWRERQMARTISELGRTDPPVVHSPTCFELSKGCSVGCWFCGVSAPRLGDVFHYTQENAQLWRELLEVMYQLLGDAAGAGFCYCASDPLDNPDYEKFCNDFYEVLGVFPQTTTAQPLKNPQRTRSLLKLALEKGCRVNRFSILSLKILDQLHKEFTPEELAFVPLVLQNPESSVKKSNSGRAREYNKRKAEKNQAALDNLPSSTACVSGFLFNMVERSVKLISPCNADERWPLGYRVYEQGTFTDISDLKVLLEGIIERQMPLTVRPNDRIGFRRDLKYESLSDGFQVSTRFLTHKFLKDPFIKELGEVIEQGNKTAAEIVSLFSIFGVPSSYIFESLNRMFRSGILDEEPQL